MTETWTERIQRTRREYDAARSARASAHDAAVKARYAEMRSADRAAGRDTSGRSVQRRHQIAYDAVNMSGEIAELRAVEDRAETAYRDARAGQ